MIREVLPMGIELVNDMSGLPEITTARLCAEEKVALLVMHSVGAPKVDHSHVQWPDIMASMNEFFIEKLALCARAELPPEAIILDPGLGFAKSPKDDLTVLQNLSDLTTFERPLLLPIGRKGFIGETLGIAEPVQRDAATLACVAATAEHCSVIYRVHEVKGCYEVLKVLQALT